MHLTLFDKVGRMVSEEALFALYGTEVSPTNFAINQSLQFTLNKVRFIAWPYSKKCYIEICYYFGIRPIEGIVRKRHGKFINSYGASDNGLCQLLYCKGQLSVSICF